MRGENSKSRDNWLIAWGDGQYESIFGKRKKTKVCKIVKYKSALSYTTVKDQPHGKDLVKLGHEINRYKKLDGADKREIDRRFKRDADSFITKKSDKTLVNNITRDVVKELRR